MSEQIWQDKITGTRYLCDRTWLQHVRAQLAAVVQVELQRAQSVQDAANRVAEFWRSTYYRLLFPLRFGRTQDEQGLFQQQQQIKAAAEVTLSGAPPLRQHFLDGSGWPPIWPDPEHGQDGWLMADRLLIEAALLNVLLRQLQPANPTLLHAARLAALTYPLRLVLTTARWLDGQVQAISDTLDGVSGQDNAVLTRLASVSRPWTEATDTDITTQAIGLVLVAGQRIKQYVFDTPGLNEIRGGSTLLDQVTDDLTAEVSRTLGPEVILRSGGSTLLFLAPADQTLAEWPPRLRRAFFAETQAAFPAAACHKATVATVLNDFNTAVGQVFQCMSTDRAQPQLSRHVTYPFETRCAFCQARAAYGWVRDADNDQQPICEVCTIKRNSGRKERRDKITDLLADLGLSDNPQSTPDLKKLGVKGLTRKEWLADDLGKLIHAGARRKLLGVVYGDGNNFGAVQINMNTMALNMQWAARVENTTRGAVALALGYATQKAAQTYGWRPSGPPILTYLPFQVLALGGDDLSLFAWGPVAVHFANEFVQLTDLELKVSSQETEKARPHLNFSLGVLLTDEKTPVRKSITFVEKDLLKWAKQANKERHLDCGTIATLYAEKADKVPASLKEYRQDIYLLGLGRKFQLCTTLRPYTAAELTALVEVADKLLENGDLGRLERLVSAFYGPSTGMTAGARQGAFAGMLHYAYQKGRGVGDHWITKLEDALTDAITTRIAAVEVASLIDYRTTGQAGEPIRTPFGIAQPPPDKGEALPVVRFSPLWDLLELAKLMS